MSTVRVLNDREIRALVRKNVRGPLAAQVKVLASGDEDGSAWVEIECASQVACQHVMVSLAAYSSMSVSDWEEGWLLTDDNAYRQRVTDVESKARELV